MEYIKIEVDPVILEVANWAGFMLPPGKTVPRIYRIKDGAAKIFFSTTSSLWIPANDVVSIEIHKDVLPTISETIFQPAPNVGISESTLLKAIAVAQDPSLIRTFEF